VDGSDIVYHEYTTLASPSRRMRPDRPVLRDADD